MREKIHQTTELLPTDNQEHKYLGWSQVIALA